MGCPEFAGKELRFWAQERKVNHDFIIPGKPHENGNTRELQRQAPRVNAGGEREFLDVDHAREVVEKWRQDCNRGRARSSLGQMIPMKFSSQPGRLLREGSLPGVPCNA